MINLANKLFFVAPCPLFLWLLVKPLNLDLLKLFIFRLYLRCFGENSERLVITLIFHSHFPSFFRGCLLLWLFALRLVEYLLLIAVGIPACLFFFFLFFWFFHGSILRGLIFFLDRVRVEQRRFHRPDSLKSWVDLVRGLLFLPLLELMLIEMISDLFIRRQSKGLLNIFKVKVKWVDLLLF